MTHKVFMFKRKLFFALTVSYKLQVEWMSELIWSMRCATQRAHIYYTYMYALSAYNGERWDSYSWCTVGGYFGHPIVYKSYTHIYLLWHTIFEQVPTWKRHFSEAYNCTMTVRMCVRSSHSNKTTSAFRISTTDNMSRLIILFALFTIALDSRREEFQFRMKWENRFHLSVNNHHC